MNKQQEEYLKWGLIGVVALILIIGIWSFVSKVNKAGASILSVFGVKSDEEKAAELAMKSQVAQATAQIQNSTPPSAYNCSGQWMQIAQAVYNATSVIPWLTDQQLIVRHLSPCTKADLVMVNLNFSAIEGAHTQDMKTYLNRWLNDAEKQEINNSLIGKGWTI